MHAMKKSFTMLFLMSFIGLAGLNAQGTCGIELGYADFPYTDGDQTIGLSTTGSGGSIFEYSYCGITTKPGSMYVGSGIGSITNTFTMPVNNLVYRFTAADSGEQVTITVDPPGTVSITYVDGDCHEDVVIAGNVFTAPGPPTGGALLIQSSSAFTSITFSHIGEENGLLMTLCYGHTYDVDPPVDPTPVPLRWWSLVVVGLMVAGFGLWRVR